MKEKRDGEWSPVLHDEIVGIVERQIAENNPKEAKDTLERLINWGMIGMKQSKKLALPS